MLNIYSFYHLNTSFSSIEKENIPNLINKCYWPLLKLIEKNLDFKIAIEASGKTISDINSIDSKWVKTFSKLIISKKCEFIGSGYCQIIGPSVPEEITEKNIKFGNEVYLKLLKIKPNLGLVSEQVFSKSMIKIYKKYFKAIFLDWINAKKCLKYSSKKDQRPSFVKDDYGNKISVIWTNSLSFQKFQRFIFGEINLNNYINYINSEKSSKFLCIYSNDCEIFNFRPKRFSTELTLLENEWEKIGKLYQKLKQQNKLKFCFPSYALNYNDKKVLCINNDANPILTKKQEKYNINRWVVSGRDNYTINRDCWRIYSLLTKKKHTSKDKWKRLCEYWSSDFRTHCTDKRYNKVIKSIKKDLDLLGGFRNKIKSNNNKVTYLDKKNYLENNNFLKFENEKTKIILNKKKGLAIDSFVVKKISNKSLFGTLYQGNLKSLVNQSDFFSGHFNLFDKNLNKITDLSFSKKKYTILKDKDKTFLVEFTQKITSSIVVKKKIKINLNKSELNLSYEFQNFSPKVLRVFNTTINPDAFSKKNLKFLCKNGGNKFEKFSLKNNFNHGKYVQDVTKFTSSNNSLQMTDGKLIIGDNKKQLIFAIIKAENPAVGVIEFENVKNKYFLRSSFSLRESDDTFKIRKYSNLLFQIKVEAKTK
tara:strand:+ start:1980 stop:3920 length:1941 start_codon:yes stop_codon:yes gene_type:complete